MKIGARRPRSGQIPLQALLIRDWALHLLGTESGPPDTLWQGAAGCDPAAWAFFLHMESCALALQSSLDADGADGWSRLPAGTAAIVRECATRELRHVLSAKAQLRTLGRLAAARGWTIMVLKGSVAVADGELLHLGDIDALVARDQVDELAAALGELGFEKRGRDGNAAHHLAARIIPNAIRIEVHRKLKDGLGLEAFRARALPLTGEPSLWRQGPADHLRYLLTHSTLQHPERTGKIRELLLLRHALRNTPADVISEVERDLAQHEAAAVILGVLRAARELNDRSYNGRDPFTGTVLGVYILFHRCDWLTRSRVGMQVLSNAGRLVGRGQRHWWPLYRQVHAAPMGHGSAYRSIDWLQRNAPRLAGPIQQILRSMAFGVATAFALAIIGEARWLERPGRARVVAAGAGGA